jgi:hypothetical protein
VSMQSEKKKKSQRWIEDRFKTETKIEMLDAEPQKEDDGRRKCIDNHEESKTSNQD